MDKFREQQDRFERPIYHFLKDRVGNACHVLADILALEAGNMDPEHLYFAREELNKIMGTVEMTSCMVQPQDTGWIRQDAEGRLN